MMKPDDGAVHRNVSLKIDRKDLNLSISQEDMNIRNRSGDQLFAGRIHAISGDELVAGNVASGY